MWRNLFFGRKRNNLGIDTSHVTIKKPPLLYQKTQQKIKEIKELIDGDFISYWISGNATIAHNDVAVLFEILKNRTHHKKLNLFIKSDGGSGETALRIIHLLRQYYNYIEGYIPLDCASAATMMAVGTNRIHMGSIAYLSAIDTSITHYLSPTDKDNDLVSVSQNELDRVIKLWGDNKFADKKNPYGRLYKYVHPLVFGAVDRASSLSTKLTTEILSYHLSDVSKAEVISNKLNSDYPSHSYPITFKEAQRIGLNVVELDGKLNRLLLDLNNLYSKMAQRASTEYNDETTHDNEILKIFESSDCQFFFQKDKDWKYRMEDRRWISLNDESSWRQSKIKNGEITAVKFHIR